MAGDPALLRYAASRRTAQGAEGYAPKYERLLSKRISSFFERRVVRRALLATGLAPASSRVLDTPCGSGRLAPLLHPVSSLLVSADYSPHMVRVLRRTGGGPALVADCFRLPFADGAFDLVFSARLSHHVARDDLRASYLREVLRVSRAWAIVTVFDARSLKALLRSARVVFGRKRPKHAFGRAQVEAIAREAGYGVAAALPLSRLASGHVYYVLRREEAPCRA